MYRVAVRERVREGDVPPPARSMKKTTNNGKYFRDVMYNYGKQGCNYH